MDTAIKAQLQAVETHAEVVPIEAAAGFTISVDDMIRH
ncbi:Nif11-like leader peptide family natural product precursor [Synechococcus lacustris]|nr:Nif11-like leader peptide family natural product precursor [Synechococcus lacustris Maggiore-St4-Slac]